MNIGDDVTISGTIVDVYYDCARNINWYRIQTKDGSIISGIKEEDIKTVRPYQPKPIEDRRTGS